MIVFSWRGMKYAIHLTFGLSFNKYCVFSRIIVMAALITIRGAFFVGTVDATESSLKEYSRSIAKEAITGYSAQKDTSSIFSNPLFIGTAAGIKSRPESVTNPVLPSLQSLLPLIPVRLADGAVLASLAPQSTSLAYNGQEQQANLNVGVGYYNSGSGKSGISGRGGFATLLGNNLSAGSAVTFDGNKSDLVINAVFQLPDSGLRIKVTGGCLWGNKQFTFTSGSSDIDIVQYDYSVSSSWIPPDAGLNSTSFSNLQSIGFTLWGASANQTSHPDPFFFTKETATEYLVYKEPFALSEGRLFGASADTQFALSSSHVVKGSLGYEQLKFPFADGTVEINRSLFSTLALYWNPLSDLTIGAEGKKGVGENRYTLSVESGHWKVDSWFSKGKNTLADDKGIMLNYSLVAFGGMNRETLAMRMRPGRTTSPTILLNEALARPVQLPLTFLAKVDPTAVSLVSRINKASLPQNDPEGAVAVSVDGDVFITVGTGSQPTIQEVRLDGAPFAYSGIIGTTATQVVINSYKLVVPGTYVISVRDGVAPNLYGIELKAL